MSSRQASRPARAVAAVLVAASLAAAPLAAQVRPATEAGPYWQRASINLIGIPFGHVSGEYEAFTTEEISLGGSAGISENSETWLEGKLRFYPSARGPRGLAVGVSAGMARIRANSDCFIYCDADGPLATGATIGAVVDYSWLLGRRERFYIGTGIGAKRVIGLDDRIENGVTLEYREVLPSFRFQTGFAF
jgi:hypothetical protein